ncbi:MAG: hypothetical protein HYZ42_12300, partial [Bacteroidetes bacterium]|nr:hypothetical protein [Bacteroidota bacterium]
GTDLNYKTEVFGVRDPVYISSNNNYSHHVIAKLNKVVGKSAYALDSMDKYFKEYEHPTYEMNIPPSKMDTGVMKLAAYFNIVNDLNITYDITFIQKLELEYPRLFRLRNASQFRFFLPSFGLADQYIKINDFGNGSKNKAYIYDFENGLKVACTISGNSLQTILPGFNSERFVYLADSTDRLSIGLMQQATFKNIDLNKGCNFLIVSHKNFTSSTLKYAGYRDSTLDSQVLVYLTKLRVYEKDINTPALWKKNILHTGGGLDIYQTQDLKTELKTLQSIAEADSFGARVSEYYKFETLPVTTSLEEELRTELKNGKSFTYYFGHGASDRMEIDLGETNSATNLNKLPVMMSAGCLLGNSYFTSTPQMGEKWLFAHKEQNNQIQAYGAVAWIGNTWYGYLYQLADYSRDFYRNAFNKHYGSSLGNLLQQTVEDYQDTTSALIESHCKQVVLMGDPAIKLYSPKYPDYLLANVNTAVGIPASLSIYPSDATAMSDSFAVKITIYNQGKSTSDSIYVNVLRVFPDKKTKTYPDLLVAAPQFSTDVYFWIKSKDINTKGKNTFFVTINSTKKVDENGAYSNNKMSFDFNMLDNNATLLFPYQYSTVSSNVVTVTAQAATIGNQLNSYTFELDTSY